jgi:hypothetical protein
MPPVTSSPANALSAGNDYCYGGANGLRITTPGPTSGKAGIIPAIGLTTATAFLSTSWGGTPLANTTLTLVEYVGTPGSYTATLDSSVVDVIIVGVSKLYLAVKYQGMLLSWQEVPVRAIRVQ